MTKLGAPTYIALLHFPVHDRKGDVVATAITNLDLHDLARSAKTYGLAAYYVVTPLERQRELARRIVANWVGETSSRAEALALIRIAQGLDEVIGEISRESGVPRVVGTSAQSSADRPTIPCAELAQQLRGEPERATLLLFGTGWGLAKPALDRCDVLLDPVVGPTSYNHLSVRAATAIILDRLFGR